jgi:hypothetical protein
MPRITYTDRFDALLAKGYLSQRDRTFAESLYGHYKRKRSLTTGRRRCFLQLEDRYAAAPQPAEGLEEMTALKGSVEAGSWDHGFVESLEGQLRAGRALSPRQTEILAKIKAKYSEAEVARRHAWADSWDADMAAKWKVLMTYYGQTGYYTRAVRAHEESPETVPSPEDWSRIAENKFARKILAGWLAEPKFPAGSMVAMAASAPWTAKSACKSGLGVVVATNAGVPTSAARGNKIYKVLPVGGVQIFTCEERHLKTARAPKKKK